MTRYQQKSFTVPASSGTAATCEAHGHAMPDQRGRCIRCGEPVPAPETTNGEREIL